MPTPESYAIDLSDACDNSSAWLAGWDSHVPSDERAAATAAARDWEAWSANAHVDLTIDQVNAIAMALTWPGEITADGMLTATLGWPQIAACEHGTGDPGVCSWFAAPGGALVHNASGWQFYPLALADEFYEMEVVPACPAPPDDDEI